MQTNLFLFVRSLVAALALSAGQVAVAVTADQSGLDTQVLSAVTTPTIFGNGDAANIDIDLSRCAAIDIAGSYTRFDCTTYFEQATGLPAFRQVIIYGYGYDDGRFQASQYHCRVLHVETLTLVSALNSPVFQGIGFWSSSTNDMRTTAKDRLVTVGTTRLKASGAEAVVHRFAGLAACWQGSGSSSFYAQYKFKPYAEYAANGTTYRKWEAVAGDHTISMSFPSWDRRADLTIAE